MEIMKKHWFANTFKHNSWDRLKQWLAAHSKNKLCQTLQAEILNIGAGLPYYIMLDRALMLEKIKFSILYKLSSYRPLTRTC